MNDRLYTCAPNRSGFGNKACLLAVFLLAFGFCLGTPARRALAAAPAAPAPASASFTPADAQQLLAVLNDPAKLAALKTTLANLQKAAAASAPPKAPLGLPQNSLGAQIVDSIDALGNGLAAQGDDVEQTLHAFSEVRPWVNGILGNPARRSQISAALVRLALVLGVAFGVTALLHVAVRRPIDALARLAGSRRAFAENRYRTGDLAAVQADIAAEPLTASEAAAERHRRARHLVDFARMLDMVRLLPFALAHFILELVPIAGFALAAFLSEIAGLVGSAQILVVIQAALSAFVIGGAIVAVIFGLFAPKRPALRLVQVRDMVAQRISFWLRLMVIVGATGFAVLHVLEFGLPDYAGSVAVKLLLLVEHGLLAMLIFRARGDIAHALQPHAGRGSSRMLLHGLIRNLWIVAIFFDFALWLIWAAQLKNGYALLLTATVKTALVIVAARLLTIAIFGGLERMFRVAAENDGQHVSASEGWTGRAGRYYPLLRRLASWMVLVVALVAVLQAWGVDAFHWFRSGAVGGRLLSALAGALVAVIASIIAWEAANIALERRIDRLQHNPAGGAAKVARLQTLMPILRITLFIFIAVILIMTVLSEIGVNIAPLLGGAGILGVAIGFGSQKLVQDFITGIFLLLENAMQVGDSVTCAGLSGTVEHLSIRTLHLRSGDGSLQIIPFSSVTTLTNSNRGLGNTPISVDIAPDEDPDKVADILKQIVREMKADPAFGSGMLSELQYWGVDKVTRQAVTLVGQIVCTDGAHDGVRREFNRRMRLVFEARGIRLAQPVQAVQLIQLSESEQAPALPSTGEAQDRSAVVKDSPPTQALGHEA